jgi:hypothetical protein
MHFVPLSQAYVLAVDLPQRADATPTWAALGPGGGSLLTGTVTMGTVNTTLNGATAAGATSLVVASATGIAAGSRYLVGGAEDSGGEFITVKSIASTTITPVRPLRLAHATGVGFQSTRVTLSLTTAASPSVGRHYRVAITWALSSVTQPPAVVAYDVVRFYPLTSLSLDRVLDADPLFAKRLSAGAWWPSLRDDAWDELLERVAAKKDPGSIVGTLDLTEPHRYLVRVRAAETAGPEFDQYRQTMAQRFLETLDAALGAHALDDNQDGAVSSNEGWRREILLERG